MEYKDIKEFNERCEEHPDHQTGMISYGMIQQRLQEEIDELREYIEQRTWVGLTDEEIEYAFKTNSVMVDNGNAYMVAGLRAVNIAQAIEAKLRSKNT